MMKQCTYYLLFDKNKCCVRMCENLRLSRLHHVWYWCETPQICIMSMQYNQQVTATCTHCLSDPICHYRTDLAKSRSEIQKGRIYIYTTELSTSQFCLVIRCSFAFHCSSSDMNSRCNTNPRFIIMHSL